MTKLPNLPWIAEIMTVFGLHEVRDKARLAAWLKSDGRTLGDPAALPWCGDAAETAVRNALPDEPLPGALSQNPYWADNWRKLGVACAPSYGCAATFSRDGGNHVGFLVGEDKDAYHVLGGNQGNRMSIARISKSRLTSTRWPVTAKDKPGPLPKRKPTDTALSINEA